MEIYVNDNKIDYQPTFPLTWGNLSGELQQNADYIKKNHVIVRVVADGEESLQVITEPSESEKMVPENIKTLQLFTKDSLSITREGFARVLAIIEGIKSEISGAAALYREGNIKEASSKIVTVMEAFKPMINFIQSVGMSFLLNFDEIYLQPGLSIREKMDSFVKTFEDLVAAQVKRDYPEIANYLDHQLNKDMLEWTRVVNLLLKEVETTFSSDS